VYVRVCVCPRSLDQQFYEGCACVRVYVCGLCTCGCVRFLCTSGFTKAVHRYVRVYVRVAVCA